MPPPSRRRWYQFSLRGLLIAVTLLCLWLGWSMNWIRERRTIRDDLKQSHKAIFFLPPNGLGLAPGGLWLLGEVSYDYILLREPVDAKVELLVAELNRLYPEARVTREQGLYRY